MTGATPERCFTALSYKNFCGDDLFCGWDWPPIVGPGGPWNEQLPISGVSGGPLNTGGVFGSGNTGPFIFSLENQSQLTPPLAGDEISPMPTLFYYLRGGRSREGAEPSLV